MDAEMQLPLFKVGDDVHWQLSTHSNPVEALKAYAEQLRMSAVLVDKVAERLSLVDPSELEIQACTHMVGIIGPDELIEGMIEDQLLVPLDYDLEDEDDDEEMVDKADF